MLDYDVFRKQAVAVILFTVSRHYQESVFHEAMIGSVTLNNERHYDCNHEILKSSAGEIVIFRHYQGTFQVSLDDFEADEHPYVSSLVEKMKAFQIGNYDRKVATTCSSPRFKFKRTFFESMFYNGQKELSSLQERRLTLDHYFRDNQMEEIYSFSGKDFLENILDWFIPGVVTVTSISEAIKREKEWDIKRIFKLESKTSLYEFGNNSYGYHTTKAPFSLVESHDKFGAGITFIVPHDENFKFKLFYHCDESHSRLYRVYGLLKGDFVKTKHNAYFDVSHVGSHYLLRIPFDKKPFPNEICADQYCEDNDKCLSYDFVLVDRPLWQFPYYHETPPTHDGRKYLYLVVKNEGEHSILERWFK
jgi:hypothetical protein